jgi:hypothetical protein
LKKNLDETLLGFKPDEQYAFQSVDNKFGVWNSSNSFQLFQSLLEWILEKLPAPEK